MNIRTTPGPKTREEMWTDIDIHFLNGINQLTLKPGDEFYDDDPTTIVIVFKRQPFSRVKINRSQVLMYEVAQRLVNIPLNEEDQPAATSDTTEG